MEKVNALLQQAWEEAKAQGFKLNEAVFVYSETVDGNQILHRIDLTGNMEQRSSY